MDTLQIETALRNNKITKTVFHGVYPADNLPLIQDATKLPVAHIANCSDSTSGGTHWVAFYQDRQDRIEVFDSYGKPLEYYNPKLLSFVGNLTVVQQSQQLQQSASTVCGQYCLFLILKRTLGITYQQLVQLFTDNYAANDKMVCQFVNCFFEMQTPVFDDSLIMEALSQSQRRLKF